jgi:histidine ammonia-lyase
MIHTISPKKITVESIMKIINTNATVKLSAESVKLISNGKKVLDKIIAQSTKPIYGINTGFGSLYNKAIEKNQLEKLQENLVMSHACGMGKMIEPEIVKLMLLLKIQGLQYGNSGVQLSTVERLVFLFNNNILPVVYDKGSLGASGDLSPLAHISMVLLGKGTVHWKNEIVETKEVYKKLKLKPLTLQAKEGLALLNGTQYMSAFACYTVYNAIELLHKANTISAMSLEAYDGRIEPFYAPLHKIRNHVGQQIVSEEISKKLVGSKLIHREKKHVQDPYSFRCIPQVHGASYDTLQYVKQVVENEINAVTDNPTLFPDEELILSGGNFHGQPLALVLDFMCIAISELGSISERRIFQLISGQRELPAFLTLQPGLNSGFMIPQYTAASITSANKQLCTPASADSIVSSNGQEDHVSMGANAANKCFEVLQNTFQILAIELLNAAQALEIRGSANTSITLKKIFNEYRKSIAFVNEDCYLHELMQKSLAFLKKNSLK